MIIKSYLRMCYWKRDGFTRHNECFMKNRWVLWDIFQGFLWHVLRGGIRRWVKYIVILVFCSGSECTKLLVNTSWSWTCHALRVTVRRLGHLNVKKKRWAGRLVVTWSCRNKVGFSYNYHGHSTFENGGRGRVWWGLSFSLRLALSGRNETHPCLSWNSCHMG